MIAKTVNLDGKQLLDFDVNLFILMDTDQFQKYSTSIVDVKKIQNYTKFKQSKQPRCDNINNITKIKLDQTVVDN